MFSPFAKNRISFQSFKPFTCLFIPITEIQQRFVHVCFEKSLQINVYPQIKKWKTCVSLILTSLAYYLFSLSHDEVVILDLDTFFSLKVNCLFMNYSFSRIHVHTLNYFCFSVFDRNLWEEKEYLEVVLYHKWIF